MLASYLFPTTVENYVRSASWMSTIPRGIYRSLAPLFKIINELSTTSSNRDTVDSACRNLKHRTLLSRPFADSSIAFFFRRKRGVNYAIDHTEIMCRWSRARVNLISPCIRSYYATVIMLQIAEIIARAGCQKLNCASACVCTRKQAAYLSLSLWRIDIEAKR